MSNNVQRSETPLWGILFVGVIALLAIKIGERTGLPTMLVALTVGILLHSLYKRAVLNLGVDFSATFILKLGIILLGARVTVSQFASLGYMPLIMVPCLILATLIFARLLARFMNCTTSLGLLSGCAVAICGSSAVLAVIAVMPQSKSLKVETLFVISIVTIFSSLAMVAYPYLLNYLGYSMVDSGVLLGASIHNVAQAVGAGYILGDDAGEIATYVKLLRVSLLPIVLIVIACTYHSKNTLNSVRNTFPWFILGFVGLLALNSSGHIPTALAAGFTSLSRFFLVMSIVAIGMMTSLEQLSAIRLKDVILVLLTTVFILLFAMLLHFII